MKLRKQVTVCGGAIFCVAVFSLYLMLDRVQHDPARRQSGGNFPRVRVITVFLKHAENIMSEKPLLFLFLLPLFLPKYFYCCFYCIVYISHISLKCNF